jgi:hypothetical protein
VQRHAEGREVKFYAVRGGRFFRCYPQGEFTVGGADLVRLQSLAEVASRATALDVLGGDVIVGANGELTLIDVNDWPSFAPCRDEGSAAIADFIEEQVHGTYRRADGREPVGHAVRG